MVDFIDVKFPILFLIGILASLLFFRLGVWFLNFLVFLRFLFGRLFCLLSDFGDFVSLIFGLII